MEIIKVEKFGGPEVLTYLDVLSPAPGSNEVLISVKASGVSMVDVMMRKGMYPGIQEAGFIPGIEIAGVITEVGDNVDKQLLNKRVFAITLIGGYAQQVIVAKENIIFIPDDVTFTEAVALGVNALVAWFSLQSGNLKKSDRLLVRGAGGGIGSLTIQIAMVLGFNVTAATHNREKQLKLKEIGLHQFYNIDDQNKSFDAIIDPVAGSDLDHFVRLLDKNGKYILNGAAAGFPQPDFGMSWLKYFQKSLSMHCVSLSSVDSADFILTMEKIFELVKEKKITPLVAKVFDFKSANEAHIYLESGAAFGKTVLSND